MSAFDNFSPIYRPPLMVIKQITEIETDKIDYIRGATIIELLSEKRLLPKRAPKGTPDKKNVFFRITSPPLTPFRATCTSFFGRQNRRFARMKEKIPIIII